MRIFKKRNSGSSDVKYKIIKRSGLFDERWYRSTYPDIGNFDPIEHYLRHGSIEGRFPSGTFDSVLYLADNSDVYDLNFNPLLHWILHGAKEGRRFPVRTTFKAQTSIAQSSIPVFALEQASKDAEAKALEDQHRQKILNSGLFDERWYRATHTDIGDYDPALHYIRHGAQEGRAASPHFDSECYLKENPDIQKAKVNPLLHWIEYGHKENRKYPKIANKSYVSSDIHKYCNPDIFEDPKILSDKSFRISIITPTYNTSAKYLKELFNSIRNQTYGNWEWVICDDCSSDPTTIAELKRLAGEDDRVRVKFMGTVHGISRATNAAIDVATGNYVALVDHDDLLARDIFELIWEAWKHNGRDCELFYTDECKISLDRDLYDFFYKPAWSPSLLENTMYIGHLSVYRRDLVQAEGGMRSQYDGTQDYDLALRLSRKIRKVVHIPQIGYFWRAIPGSTAMSLNEKNYAVQKQKEAVSAFVESFAPRSKVGVGPSAGYWRIDYNLRAPEPLLSIVIPTGAGCRMVRGKSCDLLTNCIRSLLITNFYPNMEFVVVHNGDLTSAQRSFLSQTPNVKLVHYLDRHLNLSRKMNMGVEAASGEYVCLLNDDIEAITKHAGEALVGFLQVHPGVGAIGPMCLYEDGTIQHNGILMLEQGPSHSGILKEPTYGGPFNYLRMRRESVGITGAILITTKSQYMKVGGFNEELPLNYNDVEFCSKINSSGLTCVVDPEIKVYHFESATKIGTFKCEKEMLFKILPSVKDPYFNINYDQRSPYYETKKVLAASSEGGTFERALDNHIRIRGRNLQNQDTTFTIAVSIYNQPKSLLTEMLTSLLAQTYKNIEIIIHDDASTLRETRDWVDSIREHPRVKLIVSEKNRGISGGQRVLLENTTGVYFLPVDGDDFITIDCVEILADEAFRHPETNAFYSDEFKSDLASNKFSPFYKSDFDHIKILNCCYVTHQMMFRTDFLREIDAYTNDEATWCHDWDTTLRTLQHGSTLKHVPEQLYAWRINPGSTASAETAEKPAAVASQRFVLNRYLASRALDKALLIEENKLGPNTGMWTVRAREAVPGIAMVPAINLWQQPPVKRIEILRAACAAGDYVLILLENTDQRTAELELSVPIHLDPAIKVVGSTLLDKNGKIAWAGGLLDSGNVIEPSSGMDPRQGGYHGQLYCQRLVDVVAGANALIAQEIMLQALDELGETINADSLMVTLALLARTNNWLTATTPRLEAVLPLQMRSIIPVDRALLLRTAKVDNRSAWAGTVPLEVN
ncbi:glycosyltransferase [Sphingobium sp. CECT 9361]|uniref:glycosyltransferase family 2 protein n=1 Tax=Sphingobium sp. CECT 9361 TaxID=2845384 RepID=UPI001E3344BC|nr:glycosyltransferase [Sphingobium sp. CECT 9361]CAH0357002.1 hypothetical protein SPH9361_04651 [Sphingobium sp. CECT 9361]